MTNYILVVLFMLQAEKESSRQCNVSSVVAAVGILVTIASVVVLVVYNDKLPVFKEEEQTYS